MWDFKLEAAGVVGSQYAGDVSALLAVVAHSERLLEAQTGGV